MVGDVQAIRSVGSKAGYGYYAWGVYRPTPRLDGVLTYRLVRSGPWFRSDVHGRKKFEGIPVRPGTVHGSRVPNALSQQDRLPRSALCHAD